MVDDDGGSTHDVHKDTHHPVRVVAPPTHPIEDAHGASNTDTSCLTNALAANHITRSGCQSTLLYSSSIYPYRCC